MTNVVDMTKPLLKRREEEARRKFGFEPGQTAIPIGYAAALLVERTRLRMAEQRNREAAR